MVMLTVPQEQHSAWQRLSAARTQQQDGLGRELEVWEALRLRGLLQPNQGEALAGLAVQPGLQRALCSQWRG